MNKLVFCLFVVACVVAISQAYPSAEHGSGVASDLEDSFSSSVHADNHHEDGVAHADQDDSQGLNRQKRQFFGGYGGYGGFGRRRFFGGYGGYGGYGGFRRFGGYGGYGGYGFYG